MMFDLIKNTVLYAQEECKKHSKEVSFDLTTNGTLLEGEIVEFCNLHKIGILVSVDGGPKFRQRGCYGVKCI